MCDVLQKMVGFQWEGGGLLEGESGHFKTLSHKALWFCVLHPRCLTPSLCRKASKERLWESVGLLALMVLLSSNNYCWRVLNQDHEKVWVEVRECLTLRSFGDTVRVRGVSGMSGWIGVEGKDEELRDAVKQPCGQVCPPHTDPLCWRWGPEERWEGRSWARSRCPQ